MTEPRDFHIGDIVSAGTGMLVSPRHIEGVYDILNFMTGESLFTHQLPRVCRESTPVLLRQHLSLSETFEEARQVNPDNWRIWLEKWINRHGETLPISPMTNDDHESIDALSELSEHVHPDKIIIARQS